MKKEMRGSSSHTIPKSSSGWENLMLFRGGGNGIEWKRRNGTRKRFFFVSSWEFCAPTFPELNNVTISAIVVK